MTAARSPKPRKSDELPAPSTLTYEQAIAEAEGIVDRIESGEAGIEESLAAYERGLALLARCREILEKAEQRVTELSPPKNPGRDADSESEDDRDDEADED